MLFNIIFTLKKNDASIVRLQLYFNCFNLLLLLISFQFFFFHLHLLRFNFLQTNIVILKLLGYYTL